jgi:Cu+-exporting ATPase
LSAKIIAKSQGVPASGFVGIERANKKATVQHGEMTATPGGEFVDPVCGMSVVPETAAGKYDYKNATFYFCSTGCLNKFKQNPANFLEEKKEEKQTAASGAVEYTCPMHPEILQIGPGTCPKCGMALEPKVFTLDNAPDPEFVDMKRRFWISAVLTIPVLRLSKWRRCCRIFMSLFHQKFRFGFSLFWQRRLFSGVDFRFSCAAGSQSAIAGPNMFTLIAIERARLIFLAFLHYSFRISFPLRC